jgi:uncharacterized protein (TIGR00369 family)
VPGPASFDDLYGLELLSAADGEARARVRVREHHRQPVGLVHGGLLAAIAESTAVSATAPAVDGAARGLSVQTSFLRPVTAGAVYALARCRHRGRTTWVWEVDLSDDDGRLCALARVTVAIRA